MLTLASVPITPPEGTFTTLAVNHPGNFRYVRYLGPNGSHCNIAELLVYGVPVPAAPGGLTGTMKAGSATLSWSASTYANHYILKRSTNNGGPYSVVASDILGISYSDSGLVAQGTYHYVVTAVNEAGEGNASGQITVSDSYAQWVVQGGGTNDSPASGFSADADGDGLPNGVEYAAPGGLKVTGGSQTSTITAEVRVDSTVSVTLLKSLDLVTWTPVAFPAASDQSGVPAGFTRRVAEDPASPGVQRAFYRLQLAR
ncbi:MAG: fibronectin type III domain-containing protein [Verrucomicrobiaceae bacterium]|nr:MAG: fibronectin type III domain-containing protein [Verrucomicrobiaceae bacterium]